MKRQPLRDGNQGKPVETYLASLQERHQLCNCTWVWDDKRETFRLKYMNVTCLAMHWHRQLAPTRT
jgi:hypothetical protein